MGKLTQMQVDALKVQVGNPDYNDPVVQDWIEAGLIENAAQEKRLIARFSLMEMLRDDDQMDATAKDLQKTRDAIVALKEMQAKCKKQPPENDHNRFARGKVEESLQAAQAAEGLRRDLGEFE